MSKVNVWILPNWCINSLLMFQRDWSFIQSLLPVAGWLGGHGCFRSLSPMNCLLMDRFGTYLAHQVILKRWKRLWLAVQCNRRFPGVKTPQAIFVPVICLSQFQEWLVCHEIPPSFFFFLLLLKFGLVGSWLSMYSCQRFFSPATFSNSTWGDPELFLGLPLLEVWGLHPAGFSQIIFKERWRMIQMTHMTQKTELQHLPDLGGELTSRELYKLDCRQKLDLVFGTWNMHNNWVIIVLFLWSIKKDACLRKILCIGALHLEKCFQNARSWYIIFFIFLNIISACSLHYISSLC